MRHTLLALLAAAMIMTGCTETELYRMDLKKEGFMRTVGVELQQVDSRTVLQAYGDYRWLESDTIGIFGGQTENARFTLQGTPDTGALFGGLMADADENIDVAYYPYQNGAVMHDGQLSFYIPAVRAVDHADHAPLLGHPIENGTLRFTHAGAVLFVRIVGLPADAAQVVFTAEGDGVPYLSGHAVIDDIRLHDATYRITDGSCQVTFDLAGQTPDEYPFGLYLPLQTGNYPELVMTVRDRSGQVLDRRTLCDIQALRGHVIQPPILNFSENLYFYEMTEDWHARLRTKFKWSWDGAYYLSNEMLVLQSIGDGGCSYMVADLYHTDDDGLARFMLLADMDSLNRVRSLYMDDCLYTYDNYEGETCDRTIYRPDGTVETTTGFTYRVSDSRAVSRTIGTLNGKYEAVQDMRELFFNPDAYDKARGVSANLIQLGLNPSVNTPVGIALTHARNALLEVAGDIVDKHCQYVNESRRKLLFGDAHVVMPKPKLVDGKIVVGYTVTNENAILSVKDTQFLVFMQRVPRGTKSEDQDIRPNGSIVIYSDTGTLHMDNIQIPMEKGYTYFFRTFMRSTIGVDGNWGLYSNTVALTPGAQIKEVPDSPSLTFRDGQLHLSTSVTGFTEDYVNDYYMIFNPAEPGYYPEPTVKKWNRASSVVPFQWTYPLSVFDYEKKTAPSVTVYCSSTEDTDDYLDLNIFTPTYNQEPELTIRSVKRKKISGGKTRTAFDDNEESDEDEVTVKIGSKGTALFQAVWVRCSNGADWGYMGSITDDGQEFTVTGTVKYSADEPPGTIIVMGKLLGGQDYTGGSVNLATIPVE